MRREITAGMFEALLQDRNRGRQSVRFSLIHTIVSLSVSESSLGEYPSSVVAFSWENRPFEPSTEIEYGVKKGF